MKRSIRDPGGGHGQIGFSRTRRPDAENDVVFSNLLDVGLLVDSLGCDNLFLGGYEHLILKYPL